VAAVPLITFAASRRVTISTVGRLIRSRQLAQRSGLPVNCRSVPAGSIL
jgi:hypothetical protein